MKKLIAFFLGALLCSVGFAQNEENNFAIGTQIRTRAEYRNGTHFPIDAETDPAMFIGNRSRITMDYQRDDLSMSISAQHVGVWGQDPGIVMNGRFMLNEAWASLHSGNGFFLKMGRQSLSYDDDRLLSVVDWNISGRFHDALKIGYENVQNKLHVILAFNQNNDKQYGGTYYAPGGQPYKIMQTAWYQFTGNKVFNFSLLLMNAGLEAGSSPETDVKYTQTFGTNLSVRPGNFQLYGTFYYQTGKTITDKNINAYMGAINAAYQISPSLRIMAASDYLSGDDGNDSDKYKAFNTMYGANHKFYGTMDYFYLTSFINGLNPGLWDNQLGITFKPSAKVTLALNYHHFQTTTDVYSFGEKQSRVLGSECDSQFTWNMMKDVTFSAGYSVMLGSDVMKAVKGGDPSRWHDWAWVSLNVNPKVLITKW